MLKWLRENGAPWGVGTCVAAARAGHLEALKWARENGCPWDECTCSWAAGQGHLEVLKWARENGCPWDHHTCRAAASGGYLEVLRWLRENGCPWDALGCLGEASRGGQDLVVNWLNQGCTFGVCLIPHTAIKARSLNHLAGPKRREEKKRWHKTPQDHEGRGEMFRSSSVTESIHLGLLSYSKKGFHFVSNFVLQQLSLFGPPGIKSHSLRHVAAAAGGSVESRRGKGVPLLRFPLKMKIRIETNSHPVLSVTESLETWTCIQTFKQKVDQRSLEISNRVREQDASWFQ